MTTLPSPRPVRFYWKVWDMKCLAGSKVRNSSLRQICTRWVYCCWILTGHGDVPMAVEQMKRGAVDFLQKPVSAVPLQAALEHALQVSAAAFSRQEIICCYQQLTPKERELAHLVAKGLMNREISDAMNIAVRTVEVHRARVMEKMQAGSLAELVNRLQRVQ